MGKHPEVKIAIQRISEISKRFSENFFDIVQSDGQIYNLDFFIAGASDRAISIASAFKDMLEKRNYVASTILLRSQIDTFHRVFGMTIVEDPLECAEQIFKGVRYDTIEDRNGKKLKDFHLKAEAGKIYHWLPKVYENTSGYVHMSEKNIFTVFENTDKEATVRLNIGNGGSHLQDAVFEELAAAFHHVMLICLQSLQELAMKRPNIQRALDEKFKPR